VALRGYDEDKKERNRKSRAAFADFRSRVEKTCKILGGIADWDQRLELCTELVKDLPNLLNNAGDLITKATMNELTNMLEFAKVYNKSPTTACLKLITHIDQAIDHMDAAYALLSQAGGPQPVHEPSSISMKIIVIAAAVAAVGAGAYFGLSPSEPPPPPPPPNNPPEIGPLGSITEQATSESGAIVTFEVSAYDDEDGQVQVHCTRESGSTFQIGTTVVDCKATDSNENRVEGSFFVSVRDTTPPTIREFVPTEGAKDASGAVVFFSVTAYDVVDGEVKVSCDYASGTKFPIGTTTVMCFAKDSRGNETTRKLGITVKISNGPS
jgi:hypothetical protein